MKNLLFYIFLLLTTIFTTACNDCPNDFDLERDFWITIYMYDEETKRSLFELGSKYRRDSVKVFNEQGDIVFPGPALSNGLIVFFPLVQGEEFEINSSKNSSFYLQLLTTYDSVPDVDTLRMEYIAVVNDCNEKEFTYLNVFYNEQQVAEMEKWSRSFSIAIYK